jgi:hypothetical protein
MHLHILRNRSGILAIACGRCRVSLPDPVLHLEVQDWRMSALWQASTNSCPQSQVPGLQASAGAPRSTNNRPDLKQTLSGDLV